MSTQLMACENVVGSWDFSFSFSMISLNWVSVHVLIMCFHSKLLFHNIHHYCRFISVFIIFVKCVCRLSGCKPHKSTDNIYFAQSFVLGYLFSGWHSKHMPFIYLRSWAVLTMPRKLYCSSWNCHVWNN